MNSVRSRAVIRKVLLEIEEVWVQFPSLRLGQILSNAANPRDIFYIEDDDLIQELKKFAERMKAKR